MATEVTVTLRFENELGEGMSWYDIVEELFYDAPTDMTDWEIVDFEEV